MAKRDPAQPCFAIPGLYELARPKPSVEIDGTQLGYHWKPGMPLPTLGPHSVAKHDIYGVYVDRYISTLTKRHVQSRLKMTIVDGFCGGGRYAFGDKIVDGSPLRLLTAVEAARVTLLARREDFDLDVDFVLIDENRDHLEFLREQLVQRGYRPLLVSGKIRLVNLTLEEAATKVIDDIKAKGRAHHSLFFLDQYGWSDVKLATVRRIMGSLDNPEVILAFMVDSLINLLNVKRSSISALAKIDMTREDVREMLALKDGKGWKRAIQNTVYQHIKGYTGAEFYTPFFVHPPESHRDYWLLHLFKHHQAREEMGNVFWEATNTMEHFGGAGFDALGFDPRVDVRQGMMDYTFNDDAAARSKKQLLEQIPPLLRAGWGSGAPVTKRSLFASRANDTPVVGRLVDSQLSELRNAGEIVILGRKKDKHGKKAETVRERAESFGWDDEIRFPRQPRLFSLFTKAA